MSPLVKFPQYAINFKQFSPDCLSSFKTLITLKYNSMSNTKDECHFGKLFLIFSLLLLWILNTLSHLHINTALNGFYLCLCLWSGCVINWYPFFFFFLCWKFKEPKNCLFCSCQKSQIFVGIKNELFLDVLNLIFVGFNLSETWNSCASSGWPVVTFVNLYASQVLWWWNWVKFKKQILLTQKSWNFAYESE